MDHIDKKILRILKENSRLSWKDVGEQVFMTGQSVGLRVQQLQDNKTIQKFTIQQSYPHLQIILFYMSTSAFKEFEDLVKSYDQIIEFNKTTGDTCYMIKSCFDNETLDTFLQQLLPFGRYKINQVLKTII
ncbi:AsnC family transcriptional regulator [Listeria grandensis]|uniref:Lrp/AsnC family transcriptional regulator n=1 Tax=Listeria grandensis TaxID=1494963 RepID=UPI0016284ECF|nr:AsnC family transcriptional regulator [Listeria grandensis]MBC1475980.1 AsnC family transcriptional regulator [Listeria grandensis]